METYLILIASVVVAILLYIIRFAGDRRVARFRQLGARLINLILAFIAGVIVVHAFSPRIIVATALIYAVSSVAESIWVELMIVAGRLQ